MTFGLSRMFHSVAIRQRAEGGHLSTYSRHRLRARSGAGKHHHELAADGQSEGDGKNAVICAMSYRLTRLAVKWRRWREAKQHLLVFARNKWTLKKAEKGHSLVQRLAEFERWIQFALKLPVDGEDELEVKQQCALLKCYGYYMMNVHGDRHDALEGVYKEILAMDHEDGVPLTFYAKWLLYTHYEGDHAQKALEYLEKAVAINNGSDVFLHDPMDENIKNKRFKNPLNAECILKEWLTKQQKQ